MRRISGYVHQVCLAPAPGSPRPQNLGVLAQAPVDSIAFVASTNRTHSELLGVDVGKGIQLLLLPGEST